MSYLSASITTRITKQVKIQFPHILPKEMSNFAPLVIKIMVTESLEHAVLAKESLQLKSTYEAAASLTEFELKKILIDKIDESQSYLTATEHRECYDGLIKSYDLDKSLFSTYDKVYSLKRSQKDNDKDEDPSVGSNRGLKKRKTNKDDEPTKGPKAKESKSGSSKGPAFKHLKDTRTNFAELEYDFEECYKALSEKLNWENPEGGDYPFDLTKPLPLVMDGNRIEDMVSNIWSPVKVAYDKHAIWGISHWRDQRKTFYGYARGLESSHGMYSTKRILEVTQVEVMRKHGTANVHQKHGYSEESRRFSTGSRNLLEEDQRRNRLMRSDELYKFSDGTLTGLRTLVDDITKNI
ncbi:hypothetical protein Tco_1184258 [Tanacetum coccineum]